jgi:hypothetical protein
VKYNLLLSIFAQFDESTEVGSKSNVFAFLQFIDEPETKKMNNFESKQILGDLTVALRVI